jgi:hypothetical protein
VKKPLLLTKFGRLDCLNNIYPDIKELTPGIDGQFIPAEEQEVYP